MKYQTLVLGASCSLCLSSIPSGASVFSQPWDGTSNAYASQNDTGGSALGNFGTVYDNFELAGNYNLTSVSWVGQYFNGTPATITGFTIQVYADNAGAPGASVYSTHIAGNAGETLLSGVVYSYSDTIAFSAAANTQYWLSTVPDLAFPPQWGNVTATGGDGTMYQNFLGTLSSLPADAAFSLNGTPASVPDSAPTALFFGIAIGGLACFRRRLSPLV